jgi:hypothetical protein
LRFHTKCHKDPQVKSKSSCTHKARSSYFAICGV